MWVSAKILMSHVFPGVNEARFKLITDLNKYQTFLEVAAEHISLVNLRILPAIRLDNSQTDDIISLLEEEVRKILNYF